MPPMIKRAWKRFLQPIDSWIVLLILALFCLSGIVLYSASGQAMDRLQNKILFMGISLSVMWLVANVSPQNLLRLAPLGYLIGVLLLIAVALFGDISHGARRWLHIGVTKIQPSELMKIALPMMLAWYFHQHESTLRWKDYGIAALIILVPGVLILKQPDLGTATLIMSSGFYVLFFAGLSWKVIFGGTVTFLGALPVLWNFMHEYQRQRVMTLLDPTQDPLGTGYHIIQSIIAIGSGGVLGKGWLHGTQTHLDFIPERTTDFIFAVYGEEFGLAGNLVLLLIYALMIGRGLTIAANAPSFFGRLLAGAISLTFFTYAFVNMGMVSGILPVVGVPLPLMSYGGTSMISLLIGLGMLMSIGSHRQLIKQ